VTYRNARRRNDAAKLRPSVAAYGACGMFFFRLKVCSLLRYGTVALRCSTARIGGNQQLGLTDTTHYAEQLNRRARMY